MTVTPLIDFRRAAPVALGVAMLFGACHHGSTVTDDDIEAYFLATGSCAADGLAAEDRRLKLLRDTAEDVGCGQQFDTYFHCLVAHESEGCGGCDGERDAIDACGYDPDSVCNRAEAHVADCLGHVSHPKVALCGGFVECWERCRLNATCDELTTESSAVSECQRECAAAL